MNDDKNNGTIILSGDIKNANPIKNLNGGIIKFDGELFDVVIASDVTTDLLSNITISSNSKSLQAEEWNTTSKNTLETGTIKFAGDVTVVGTIGSSVAPIKFIYDGSDKSFEFTDVIKRELLDIVRDTGLDTPSITIGDTYLEQRNQPSGEKATYFDDFDNQ
jgi:hypothetical protein